MGIDSAQLKGRWKPGLRQKAPGLLQRGIRRLSGDHVAAPLLLSAATVLGSVFAVAAFVFMTLGFHLSTGLISGFIAAAMLLCIFLLVLTRLRDHGHEKFGYANTVTAIRAAIACFAGSELLLQGVSAPGETTDAILIALIIFALALDGVDGWLARRFRQQSALGARFDMEVDAFLILLLSAAALLIGKAGVWVLLIGLMRYVFVLFQQFMPKLNAPLYPSFRRQAICVVQVSALCIILLPVIVPPYSDLIAATALLLLTYSFSTDTFFLLRKRKTQM